MYVELVDEEDARDAIADLLHTKRLEGAGRSHIRVQLDLPLRQLSRDSLRYFFDCIRNDWCETAVELYITSRRRTTRVDELAFILEHGPNLHHLEIDELSLGGSNIDKLAQAICSQCQLRTVYLCELQHVDSSVDLGPFATALCKLPKLEALELYHVRFSKQSALNQQSLASIARFSKAKTLEVMPCVDHDLQETGMAVTEALATNTSLERLCLVTCIFPKPFMFQDSVISSAAQALQSNNTKLRELELNVKKDVDLVPLAQALKTNTSLQALSLCWDTHSIPTDSRNLAALREVLRDHNFTLQRLDITLKNRQGVFEKQWTDRELELYLQLNRMGRQSIIRRQQEGTVTPQDWINILSKTNNEPSASFYLLNMYPTLCYEFAPASGTKREHLMDCDTSNKPRKRQRSGSAWQ